MKEQRNSDDWSEVGRVVNSTSSSSARQGEVEFTPRCSSASGLN